MNRPFLSLAGRLTLFLSLASLAQAELKFEAPVQERTVSVAEDKVSIAYAFTNTGPTKVKIEKVETTCGCLHADADKMFYDVGESGVIEATFSVNGKAGLHSRVVEVQTSLASQRIIPLTVKIDAKPLMTITPQILSWKVGEAPTPKRFTLKVAEGHAPIEIEKITLTRKGFATQFITVEEGSHYEVELTPEDTSSSLLGAVKLETDSKYSSQKKQMAFFRVEN